MDKKVRIMIGKVGCDIHERGALTMMNVFRDEGWEVIYTGRYQAEATVANAAIAEDVDLLIVSDLSGNLPSICEKILNVFKAKNCGIPLMCGGLMTENDIKSMANMGVVATFPTGSDIDECVDTIKKFLND